MLVSILSLSLLSYTSALILPRQGAITTLSTAQIDAFTPYAHFASAAYCNPNTTINWSCGADCDANPGFLPTASGGDGAETQFWYVGFDPTLNSVIVAHQGTDPSKIAADLTDANFFLEGLDQTSFPGTSGLEAHDGFLAGQARAAPDILTAVQKTLTAHGTQSVTMVGHSLGSALSLIDSVFLPLHLGPGLTFKFVGFSMPRVGNPAFANYLDAHFSDLTHVNNKEDVVPILPGGRFLGFQHPHGEIHINDTNAWNACTGDDNDSNQCSTGDVSNIFVGKVSDHDGPFNGVTMAKGC